MELIRSELHRDLSVEDLALSVGVSPSWLTELFNHDLGISPYQFLREARLAQARELLETTLLPVSQIMRATGFRDSSHFCRDFKCRYGAAPSRFRRFRSQIVAKSPTRA